MSVSPIAIHEPTPITTCNDFNYLQQSYIVLLRYMKELWVLMS